MLDDTFARGTITEHQPRLTSAFDQSSEFVDDAVLVLWQAEHSAFRMQSFWSFRAITEHDQRDPQMRSLFLDATGVGHDQGIPR